MLPANEDIENFQMPVSLIFQFKESQFLLRIVAEYIGDVIFVWSPTQKFKKKKPEWTILSLQGANGGQKGQLVLWYIL